MSIFLVVNADCFGISPCCTYCFHLPTLLSINCNSHIAKKKEESQSLMCLNGDNLSFQARTHHNNTGHLSTDLFLSTDYLSRKWSVHKLITFANLGRDVRHWSNQKMQTLSIQLIKIFCWLLITCLATSWVQKFNNFFFNVECTT